MSCRCNYILDCDGKPKPFTVEDQEKIVKNVIEPMAGDGLRTICMAYKDYHTDASKSPKERALVVVLRILESLTLWSDL